VSWWGRRCSHRMCWGPSSRIKAWKWPAPWRWNSATLAYCTVATSDSRSAGSGGSRASERRLLLPSWCVDLLKARRVRLGAFDGPVFPDTKGGWRDRSNVGKAFRRVRDGSDFEWVKTHMSRKTVATLLDGAGPALA